MARPSTDAVLHGNEELPAEPQQTLPAASPSPLQEKVAEPAPARSAEQIPPVAAANVAAVQTNGCTGSAPEKTDSQEGGTNPSQQLGAVSTPNGEVHASPTPDGMPAVQREVEAAATTLKGLKDISATQTLEYPAALPLQGQSAGASEAAGPSQPPQQSAGASEATGPSHPPQHSAAPSDAAGPSQVPHQSAEAAGPSQPEAAAEPQPSHEEGGATPEMIAAVNEKYHLNEPYKVSCSMLSWSHHIAQ